MKIAEFGLSVKADLANYENLEKYENILEGQPLKLNHTPVQLVQLDRSL